MKRRFERIRHYHTLQISEKPRKVERSSQADDSPRCSVRCVSDCVFDLGDGVVDGLHGLRGDVGDGGGDGLTHFWCVLVAKMRVGWELLLLGPCQLECMTEDWIECFDL